MKYLIKLVYQNTQQDVFYSLSIELIVHVNMHYFVLKTKCV